MISGLFSSTKLTPTYVFGMCFFIVNFYRKSGAVRMRDHETSSIDQRDVHVHVHIHVKCLCIFSFALKTACILVTSPLPPSLIFVSDFGCFILHAYVVKPISSGWAMSTNKCAGLGAASHKIGVLFWFLNEDINNLFGWDWSN